MCVPFRRCACFTQHTCLFGSLQLQAPILSVGCVDPSTFGVPALASTSFNFSHMNFVRLP